MDQARRSGNSIGSGVQVGTSGTILQYRQPESACDALIVGGELHGLSIACNLARCHRVDRVAVLERHRIGLGGSGRNTETEALHRPWKIPYAAVAPADTVRGNRTRPCAPPREPAAPQVGRKFQRGDKVTSTMPTAPLSLA